MKRKIITILLPVLMVTMMPLPVIANTNSAVNTDNKEMKYYTNEYAGNHHSGYKHIKSIKSRQMFNLGTYYNESTKVIDKESATKLTPEGTLQSSVGLQGYMRLGDVVNAKKIKTYVEFYIRAGAATPAPPIAPGLGRHGVNIMDFCKQFNAETQDRVGELEPIKTVITIYVDRSFSIEYKS